MAESTTCVPAGPSNRAQPSEQPGKRWRREVKDMGADIATPPPVPPAPDGANVRVHEVSRPTAVG